MPLDRCVYARESKRSHALVKCKTCSGLIEENLKNKTITTTETNVCAFLCHIQSIQHTTIYLVPLLARHASEEGESEHHAGWLGGDTQQVEGRGRLVRVPAGRHTCVATYRSNTVNSPTKTVL